MYLKLKTFSPADSRYIELKQNLSVLNNIIKKDIRKEKKIYYSKTFENYKNDIKNTWKTISCILNKSKSNKVQIEQIISSGNVISDKSKIANEFNNFFVNIGPELASKIDIRNKKSYKSYLNRVVKSEFRFNPIENEFTLKVTNSLLSKSSCGHDELSTKFLKSITPVLLPALTLVINQSLMTGFCPK